MARRPRRFARRTASCSPAAVACRSSGGVAARCAGRRSRSGDPYAKRRCFWSPHARRPSTARWARAHAKNASAAPRSPHTSIAWAMTTSSPGSARNAPETSWCSASTSTLRA
ncbi:MAG: hypothetical protein E6I04_08335 [Chloroflexi bacterium]|nr:MAG: hypothetical protein E6I04_08335 [Chloroflexota bacterium]